ncbi:hypothetical protein ACN47E_009239 [Coniothyrium glycines]
MVTFRGFSATIWNYMSPRKTQQRREKPFKKPDIPLRNHAQPKANRDVLEKRDTSPESRVHNWTPRAPSPQSDIDVTLLPPSPPASALQSHDDFEGDTLVPGSPWSPSNENHGSSEEEWNANEDTMVVDDGAYMLQQKRVNIDHERRRREQQSRELRDAGWSEDAVFLFQKLALRGFEPIIPTEWFDDFETLPEDLFTASIDKAFIRPSQGSDYNAQLALNKLFELGGHARDAWQTRARVRTPAFHIKQAVQNYTAWAMRDGRIQHLWPALPLFQIVTWSAKTNVSVGEQIMLDKLRKLHTRWYEALRNHPAALKENSSIVEVPTLYGVTASHSVMAFVSYAPPSEENEKAQLRLIAMFDFGKEDYDVWNALAIAIFVIHCRNRMIQLKECLPEPPLKPSEDPDL